MISPFANIPGLKPAYIRYTINTSYEGAVDPITGVQIPVTETVFHQVYLKKLSPDNKSLSELARPQFGEKVRIYLIKPMYLRKEFRQGDSMDFLQLRNPITLDEVADFADEDFNPFEFEYDIDAIDLDPNADPRKFEAKLTVTNFLPSQFDIVSETLGDYFDADFIQG